MCQTTILNKTFNKDKLLNSFISNIKIVELCNCNVRKFDPDGLYETISPHSANLNTYTWKPLIIQVK